MSAILLDGKATAQVVKEELQQRIATLKENTGIVPGLAVIIVGEDPASMIYVRNKENACETVGIYSQVIRLPDNTSQVELDQVIERLNKDTKIHGILVQLPLPKHLNDRAVIEGIDPKKDVDGFSSVNAGGLMIGMPAFVPCTPKGCMRLLRETGESISGKEAIIIGRSNIVGKPMAMLLLEADATVTICHSKTQNLPEVVKRADIIVAAIGRPCFVTADMVKKDAIVIDVGINRGIDGKLTGDVDFETVKEIVSFITPVPGGVGPMTIAMLLENTVEAAEVCQSIEY